MKENLEHGCSFKFILKVGVEVEDSIFCLNLTSLFALFVFLLCRLTSGAFTNDSSTPTSRRNLNEHPIEGTLGGSSIIENKINIFINKEFVFVLVRIVLLSLHATKYQ
jgi:hypothetical protein